MSYDVQKVAHLSIRDIISMQVTFSELGAAVSNMFLVFVGISMETVVTEFKGKAATVVICAMIVGPALLLVCLWSVSHEILCDHHRYLDGRKKSQEAPSSQQGLNSSNDTGSEDGELDEELGTYGWNAVCDANPLAKLRLIQSELTKVKQMNTQLQDNNTELQGRIIELTCVVEEMIGDQQENDED